MTYTLPERAALSLTADDLDNLYRLASAKRELGDIAGALHHSRTSKREDRREMSDRLWRVWASLDTIEQRLGPEDAS